MMVVVRGVVVVVVCEIRERWRYAFGWRAQCTELEF